VQNGTYTIEFKARQIMRKIVMGKIADASDEY